MSSLAFSKILLKYSGEAVAGNQEQGIDLKNYVSCKMKLNPLSI
ncbi:MAG: hypothetical protein CM15mP31_3680 [Gammaproteobacteria bacterium]|nr:MAG: hypothetical protein CM15mP31_3680 [Gammaproteobacteria bacterium]